ncbi:MAG: hypothetical protein Q8916_12910 [Bacteroidota bacterium]|nr:hypothetical protein [Bacteroidota bacterium]MDP4231292.1 hypothetical protein [Bacteroidota bacterium]MDP4235469.1 hypothetical protein [Bacteroidota bacterium]
MKYFFIGLVMWVCSSNLAAQTSMHSTVPSMSFSPLGFTDSCVTIGDTVIKAQRLSNLGSIALTITGVQLTDTSHFRLLNVLLPLQLDPGKEVSLVLEYIPTHVGLDTATLYIWTDTVQGKSEFFAGPLAGCGIIQSSVHQVTYSSDIPALEDALQNGTYFVAAVPSPNPSPRNGQIRFVFGLRMASEVEFEISDIRGNLLPRSEMKDILDAGIHSFEYSTKNLAPGTYFYRYIVTGQSYCGSFIIQ